MEYLYWDLVFERCSASISNLKKEIVLEKQEKWINKCLLKEGIKNYNPILE